ncbi:uncharacterized protein LOC113467099 [Diaphorina citri]|uniref:Uncharacterized protein LOC113467099 n=1 Tax=Diaphorina citri TaxID=121845 RepID=A0A3Q0IRK4_DIACI|nr:uncharacterized protein LOC113467099 [Diaphorina citri]
MCMLRIICVHIYLDTYAKNLFHKLCTLYPLFIFRENRYSLKISEDTFSSLETFFTQEINFPFLELIQSKIDLTISDIKDLDDGPETEPDTFNANHTEQKYNSDPFRVNYENIPEYKRFLEAKRNLKNVCQPNPVHNHNLNPEGDVGPVASEDGLVLTHELTTGRVISRFHLQEHEPVTSLVWSVTGETLVTGSLTGTVQFYAWPSASKM